MPPTSPKIPVSSSADAVLQLQRRRSARRPLAATFAQRISEVYQVGFENIVGHKQRTRGPPSSAMLADHLRIAGIRVRTPPSSGETLLHFLARAWSFRRPTIADGRLPRSQRGLPGAKTSIQAASLRLLPPGGRGAYSLAAPSCASSTHSPSVVSWSVSRSADCTRSASFFADACGNPSPRNTATIRALHPATSRSNASPNSPSPSRLVNISRKACTAFPSARASNEPSGRAKCAADCSSPSSR